MDKYQDFISDSLLEELEVFRWRLCVAKDESAKDKRKLFEEACSRQISEYFIEECIIAGCDVNLLSNEAKLKANRLMQNGELLSIQREDDKFWDFSRLRTCLLHANESLFIKGLNLIARKSPKKLKEIITNSDDLFNLAASNNLTLAIDALISFGANVEYSAYLYACKSGSWRSLKTLMKYLNSENKMPLLRELFISARGADNENRENFEKCYDLLLDDSDFDVNSTDSTGNSAMYYVRSLPKKIEQFLEMGAYIGMQNASLKPNVSFIGPKKLEDHFNNCVNFVQSEDVENKKVTYIEFNYKNLIATRSDSDNVLPNEMTAIQFLSKSIDYRHLLVHPLIWSFISLKWRQMVLIHYIDFFLYLLLALANVGYIFTIYIPTTPSAIKTTFFILNAILMIYVALRRIIHLMFCSIEYRKSWMNCFHCLQTGLVLISVNLVLLESGDRDDHRIIPAICVLLITCELFALAGSIFWTFSLYYRMFLTVVWSSIKCLTLYILLLPSFIISYYLLITSNTVNNESTYKQQFFEFMQQAVLDNPKNVDVPQLDEFKKKFFDLIRGFVNDEDDGPTGSAENHFAHLLSSLMKTIIEWHKDLDEKIVSSDWSYLGVIVVLITLISVIFMNLMNGIAVSDTQIIQSEAELTCLTQRCHLLAQYEEALTNQRLRFMQTWNNTYVMRLFDYFTQLDVLEGMRHNYHRKIYIGPKNEIIYRINIQNGDNFMKRKKSLTQHSTKDGDIRYISSFFNTKKLSQVALYSEENELESKESQPHGCSRLWKKFTVIFFDECERMDSQIVQNAKNLIERRRIDEKEKFEQDSYLNRIEKLETAIDLLTNKLNAESKNKN